MVIYSSVCMACFRSCSQEITEFFKCHYVNGFPLDSMFPHLRNSYHLLPLTTMEAVLKTCLEDGDEYSHLRYSVYLFLYLSCVIPLGDGTVCFPNTWVLVISSHLIFGL